MGKRCDCAGVLAVFENDVRLLGLPLAARALWLLLVRRMQGMGLSVLTFGSDIPNPAEIARVVAVSETELETHLVPLLARGLLVRREDGALSCPLLEARDKRAETARINGLRGGRPRKDWSAPGQRHMALPIAGGRAAADAETQAKPNGGAVGLPAKLSSGLLEEKAEASKPRAVTPEEVQRVGFAAAEAAGLDPAKGTWTLGVVRQWLELGADEALILGVIAAVMARPNPPAPRGLGYFGDAVRAAVVARPVVAVAVAPNPGDEPAEAYNARYDAWEAAGRLGEPPVRRRAVAA